MCVNIHQLRMIYYFSGTGNTKIIAQLICQQTGDTMQPVTEVSSEIDADVLGFVFPVYAWGPALPMIQFIEKINVVRPPSYTYVICTCGDDIGRTDRIINRILKSKSLRTDAIWSLQMPNTYIGLPGFDVDSNQLAQKKWEYAQMRVQEISKSIHKQERGICCIHPGVMPWTKTYILRPLFNRFLTKDKKFHTTQQCTGCGLCVKVCPKRNLTMEGKHPQWHGNCINCFACYHQCPQHAILYGKGSKGKGQYRCTDYFKFK